MINSISSFISLFIGNCEKEKFPTSDKIYEFKLQLQGTKENAALDIFKDIQDILLKEKIHFESVDAHYHRLYNKFVDLALIITKLKINRITSEWIYFLEFLETQNLKIYRKGAPTLQMKFSIARAISEGKSPSISIESINSKSPSFLKVIEQIGRISIDGLGYTLGRNILNIVLSSNNTRCIVAKTETQDIVGFGFGTLLNINKNGRIIRIFHIWNFARQADAGKLGIGNKLLEESINLVSKDFDNLDCITLVTRVSNFAMKALCNNFLFQQQAVFNKSYSNGEDGIFYVKNLNHIDKFNIPNRDEIDSSIKTFSKQATGSLIKMTIYFACFKVIQLWNHFYYR